MPEMFPFYRSDDELQFIKISANLDGTCANIEANSKCQYGGLIEFRELKNHDEVYDEEVC